jgi:hypothetical protein
MFKKQETVILVPQSMLVLLWSDVPLVHSIYCYKGNKYRVSLAISIHCHAGRIGPFVGVYFSAKYRLLIRRHGVLFAWSRTKARYDGPAVCRPIFATLSVLSLVIRMRKRSRSIKLDFLLQIHS